MNAGNHMGDLKRVGELEVPQDLDFQRREWFLERVGWAIMFVIAVATLLGLFGRGWLSNASVGDQGASLRVQYERFTRLLSNTAFTVTLGPGATRGDTARVWIDRDFRQSIQIVDMAPQPARVVAGPDRVTYLFLISSPARAVTVTLQFQPQHPWQHAAWIGTPGSPPLHITQFVFP